MVPLRYPWLWSAFGWLLAAGVCFGSLVPGDKLPVHVLQDKAVHFGSYLLLMIWFAGLYERRRQLAVALALVALGFALDALQSLVSSRSFELLDVLANAAGVAVGFVLASLLLAGWCQRVERLLLT